MPREILTRRDTHQPLSAPFSRNEQSPLVSQVQPPPMPTSFLHLTSGICSGRSCDHISALSARTLEAGTGAFLRVNFEKPHVNALNSPSPTSSGMRPVKTLPIAITDAACVQISSDLASLWLSSTRRIRCFRQYALKEISAERSDGPSRFTCGHAAPECSRPWLKELLWDHQRRYRGVENVLSASR